MPCPDHLEIPSLTLLAIMLNVFEAAYSQTYQVSCSSVWYIHAAYTTSSWPAAVTLCASLAVLIT